MAIVPLALLSLACLALIGVALRVRRPGAGWVRLAELAAWLTIGVAALNAVVSVGYSLIGNITTFQVAVESRVPEVRLPGLTIDPPSALITSGGVDRATLTVTGLGWAGRLLLASETLLQTAVTIVIALMVLRLARNVRAGRPFNGLNRAVITSAVVLFLGAGLWSVVGGIGSYIAGREALEIHGMSANEGTIGAELFPETTRDLSYYGWPSPTLSIVVPFWPLGIAVALVLLSLAFRAGEQMQADTEGLV